MRLWGVNSTQIAKAILAPIKRRNGMGVALCVLQSKTAVFEANYDHCELQVFFPCDMSNTCVMDKNVRGGREARVAEERQRLIFTVSQTWKIW